MLQDNVQCCRPSDPDQIGLAPETPLNPYACSQWTFRPWSGLSSANLIYSSMSSGPYPCRNLPSIVRQSVSRHNTGCSSKGAMSQTVSISSDTARYGPRTTYCKPSDKQHCKKIDFRSCAIEGDAPRAANVARSRACSAGEAMTSYVINSSTFVIAPLPPIAVEMISPFNLETVFSALENSLSHRWSTNVPFSHLARSAEHA